MDDLDEFDEEYDNFYSSECECIETDLDILTGEETCRICRRTRMLGGEEFSRRLKQEAEWAEAYNEEMAKA